MKLCISVKIYSSKFLSYFVLFAIFEIYKIIVIYYDGKNRNILGNNKLFNSSCFFLGYLLNIFPALIIQRNSEINEKLITKEYEGENQQSIKYIIIFFIICFILLLADSIENFIYILLNKLKNEHYEVEDFIFIEFIVIFLLSKYSKEVFYIHQNISFLILIFVEIIKTIFLLRDKFSLELEFIFLIFLNIIYSILYAIYYIYIQKLMKYKYISPYKSNFMIGLINLPITIIIYIIISFTPLGDKDNDYFYDSIFDLFKNIGNLNTINIILLITLPFTYGIILLLTNKIINELTIYHIYIPTLLDNFISIILKNSEFTEKIFLILSFFIELIMILIFLEEIEINFCGLNENLKRNIEKRSIIESSLINENGKYEFDKELNFIDNESEQINKFTEY